MTQDELEALEREIKVKFARRIALYDAGETQWDTYIAHIMMLRGVK